MDLHSKLPFVLGALGLLAIACGLMLRQLAIPNKPVEIIEDKPSLASASAQIIHVDVSGAVNAPGVYTLPVGSLVEDAIITAGGFSADVDAETVAQTLNRAAKLVDSAKIYVAKRGQASTVSNISKYININTASLDQLDILPGIGPATAEKIISGRPYQKVEELVERKIVSSNVWQKIKERVRVY